MTDLKTLDDQQTCACGSRLTFSACCKPLLADHALATSAEQLMRSRYTAFYLGNTDYLNRTLHPKFREEEDAEELSHSLSQQDWVSLRLLHTEKGSAKDTKGTVEFIAYYQHAHSHGDDHHCDGLHQLHERAFFIKENNLWYYTQGEFLKPIKLGRNDPCWCGSNKKFKQCHES